MLIEYKKAYVEGMTKIVVDGVHTSISVPDWVISKLSKKDQKIMYSNLTEIFKKGVQYGIRTQQHEACRAWEKFKKIAGI